LGSEVGDGRSAARCSASAFCFGEKPIGYSLEPAPRALDGAADPHYAHRMNTDAELRKLSEQVGAKLLAARRLLVTAESCTGGWIGKALTDISGSSSWYLGGAISYSNELKQVLLGVKAETLAAHGAVSAEVAREMAAGALARFSGDIAIAVTGIAGPNGGTQEKPVGTVWFGWAVSGSSEVRTLREAFSGDREQVRRATVHRALTEVLSLV
jgi:nicotinamide-nucleotide amidase